jgi:hypothetical protein
MSLFLHATQKQIPLEIQDEGQEGLEEKYINDFIGM